LLMDSYPSEVLLMDSHKNIIEYDHEKSMYTYKDKGLVGRIHTYQTLKNNNIPCLIIESVIGPSIVGAYRRKRFFVTVRYWSKSNTPEDCNDKFDEFMDKHVPKFEKDYFKFYYCTCNPTDYITKRLLKLPNIFYVKDPMDIVQKFEIETEIYNLIELPILRRDSISEKLKSSFNLKDIKRIATDFNIKGKNGEKSSYDFPYYGIDYICHTRFQNNNKSLIISDIQNGAFTNISEFEENIEWIKNNVKKIFLDETILVFYRNNSNNHINLDETKYPHIVCVNLNLPPTTYLSLFDYLKKYFTA
ncbi:25901_t:CDS:1, partial [Gigaspora rosea]